MKTALITGGARGIGKAITLELASSGFNVIINYNKSFREAESLKKYIEDTYKVKALIVKADIAKEQDIINMKNIVKEFSEKIDVLVNNAAISIDTTYEGKTKENFMKILEVNLVGTFLVTKHIGELMLENKNGRIINISSDAAINKGYVEGLDYDASKAGIISLTKDLAKYYAPYINVNCIAPGWVDTEMNKLLTDQQIEDECKKILLNRFAKKEEIAKVVKFLCSDDASYINGTVIKVDGGSNE